MVITNACAVFNDSAGAACGFVGFCTSAEFVFFVRGFTFAGIFSIRRIIVCNNLVFTFAELAISRCAVIIGAMIADAPFAFFTYFLVFAACGAAAAIAIIDGAFNANTFTALICFDDAFVFACTKLAIARCAIVMVWDVTFACKFSFFYVGKKLKFVFTACFFGRFATVVIVASCSKKGCAENCGKDVYFQVRPTFTYSPPPRLHVVMAGLLLMELLLCICFSPNHEFFEIQKKNPYTTRFICFGTETKTIRIVTKTCY